MYFIIIRDNDPVGFERTENLVAIYRPYKRMCKLGPAACRPISEKQLSERYYKHARPPPTIIQAIYSRKQAASYIKNGYVKTLSCVHT